MKDKYGSLELFNPDISEPQAIPFSENGVAAGFPSPAEDFMDLSLDLNKEFQPIVVNKDNDFQIWGVVRYIIKKV